MSILSEYPLEVQFSSEQELKPYAVQRKMSNSWVLLQGRYETSREVKEAQHAIRRKQGGILRSVKVDPKGKVLSVL